MSHIHFTSTQLARQRVIGMGEEPWRVHHAGAPSLDHLRRSRLLTREELEQRLQLNLIQPTILVAYHPVTIRRETTEEVDALFAALSRTEGQILFCFPNADAGSHHIVARTRNFLETRQDGKVFTNLDPVTYWSLLGHIDALVGNSSSGIMETASFALPTVNIGLRQKGRERPANVIDAAPETADIREKIKRASSKAFRESLEGMQNPYGDGHAAETIVKVLTSVPLTQDLLMKQAQ
jgi:UDP-N-acetylglucosamine 2-epimerase (non-hydrolysing)/GDP/UDP-N,N'-diacetylbacillosamine 2-epimerase (hydrolysing)